MFTHFYQYLNIEPFLRKHTGLIYLNIESFSFFYLNIDLFSVNHWIFNLIIDFDIFQKFK